MTEPVEPPHLPPLARRSNALFVAAVAPAELGDVDQALAVADELDAIDTVFAKSGHREGDDRAVCQTAREAKVGDLAATTVEFGVFGDFGGSDVGRALAVL